MTLVGYARVSTVDQNPQLQIDALKAVNCVKIFVEKASGADRSRPKLEEALSFVIKKKGVLCCWKMDRIGRSLSHLVEIIARLEAAHVGFRCLTQAIDTTTPGGKLVFHIFAAIAEFEREMIRERTRAGIAAAIKRGARLGPPQKIPETSRARVLELIKAPAGRALACKEFDVTYVTLRRFLGETPPQQRSSHA